MNIFLIRHGETIKNQNKKNGIKNVCKNSRLTEKGKKDAQSLCEILRKNIGNERYIIISSPRIRAIQTSEIIINTLSPNSRLYIDDNLYNAKMSRNTNEIRSDFNNLLKFLSNKEMCNNIIIITHKHMIRYITANIDYVDNCQIIKLFYNE